MEKVRLGGDTGGEMKGEGASRMNVPERSTKG